METQLDDSHPACRLRCPRSRSVSSADTGEMSRVNSESTPYPIGRATNCVDVRKLCLKKPNNAFLFQYLAFFTPMFWFAK